MAEPVNEVPVDRTGFQTAGYYAEPPELLARNISTGTRLLCASLFSFFGAFLFAYVYLRERDTSGVWRPHGVNVPLGTGIAILACVLASAAVTALAVTTLRSRGEAAWRVPVAGAELLLLAALGIQCYQWAVLGFGPGSGPWASVFIAWTGFYAGFFLPTAIYWAHTNLASSLRRREQRPGDVVAVADHPTEQSPFRARLGSEASSRAFYLYFLAGVEVVTFILLYIVA